MSEGGEITISAENFIVQDNSTLPLVKGNYIRIAIKDQGPGIAREHISKIFDPFFTTKTKGSGLGLATCFSIIQKHEGFIDVETELEKGSTFFLYLPISKTQAETVITNITTVYKGKGRILIMDDEEFIREIAKETLKNLGYEAILATCGEDAISLVKYSIVEQKPFDAVILDLTVIGAMGGKETIKKIRELDPNIKAVVSSGYSNDPVMADPQAFGFLNKIKKPYLKQELAEVLFRVLRNE
jgi:two-component system, cell cycle sensor histidine kinase and response regulator CckA